MDFGTILLDNFVACINNDWLSLGCKVFCEFPHCSSTVILEEKKQIFSENVGKKCKIVRKSKLTYVLLTLVFFWL